ncbi:MAG: DNA polymerase III subunit gamma/tau [Armatimonadota bacterium]
MAYQSLYRKYRPQSFGDVVGQGHVVRTLRNALASGRVAHGYLFTGTRGTAKTTVARLLAKCLNCEAADAMATDPCNQCEACLSIMQGGCIDVIEMDAASHRGVADIEEVRKAVGFGPMRFRTKVFIIDEAHQLSSDAKDAFLKTLEEPPPRVVFILATTEPQAIPITIRSRCQQFDFKRGTVAEIAGRLRTVLDAEGVVHDGDAVVRIARAAEGSYRDSLSLLEQVLAFADGRITSTDVDSVLGTLDAATLDHLVEAMRTGDAAAALTVADAAIDAGKEARTLLRAVAAHLRDLLLLGVAGHAAVPDLSDDEARRLHAIAGSFAPDTLVRGIDLCTEAIADLRWNNQHRIAVELAFLKLAGLASDRPSRTDTPATIVPARNLAPAQSIAPAPVAVPAAPPAAPAPAPASKAPDAVREPAPAIVFGDSDRHDPEDDHEPGDLSLGDEDPPNPGMDGPGLFDDPPTGASVATDAEEAPDPLPFDDLPTGALRGGAEPEPTAPVSAVVPPVETPAYSLDDVVRAWPRFLAMAEKVSKQAQVFLTAARPSSVDGRTVVITFANRANREMMGQQKQIDFIKKILAKALGVDGSVPVRLESEGDSGSPTPRASGRARVRHDAKAALEALDLDATSTEGHSAPPPWHPSTAAGNDPPRAAVPVAPPAPVPAPVPDPTPAPPPAPVETPSKPAGDEAHHPLVQDILATFGGSILDD